MRIKHPYSFMVGAVVVALAVCIILPTLMSEPGLTGLCKIVTGSVIGALGIMYILAAFTD